MEHCAECGEPLGEDQLCGVCLLAGGIETGAALPARIGRYRIMRLVGEGGMGAVYEAEQVQPHRVVALKVIKTAFIDPELLRRFTRESEALARLQHPGIAQIYEAGAAEGEFGPQPYFAMELVQGQPLDEYARVHRLGVRERLNLMCLICDAVEHAHQRGIIHRDLKPANILVDGSGNPKILDFGVARVTDSDSGATRQTDMGQLVGTLAYMSPEQVSADPLEIDTRSDVYSLGIVFYELLAGSLPYRVTHRLHEAMQVIREQNPARLSAVSRVYRGDIETIAAKALEKDKTRRYASAASLAADIRRHLDNQPIAARPPSATYQLGKFARRHKALVASLATVFLALVAGIVASTLQARRALRAEEAALAAKRAVTQERDRAVRAEARAKQAGQEAAASAAQALNDRDRALREKQRADTEAASAKAVNDFLQQDLLAQASNAVQAGPETKPDPDLRVRTALDRAAARIEGRFAAQPLVEAAIRHTIGDSYMNLGLYQAAQRQFERAIDLRRRLSGENSAAAGIVESRLAMAYYKQGKYEQAEEHAARAVEVEKRSLGLWNPHTLLSMSWLALVYLDLNRLSQAEQLLTETLEVQRRVLGEEDVDTLKTWGYLGTVYEREGRPAQALPVQARVLETLTRLKGTEHPLTLAAMSHLANDYRDLGNDGQAEILYRKLLQILYRVRGKDHPNTLTVSYNFGILYRREGKYDEAEPLLARTAEARRRVLGPQHPDTIAVLADLAFVRLRLKKYAEAEKAIRESLAAHEKKAPVSWLLLNDQVLLGASLAGQGKYAEAEPLLVGGYGELAARASAIPDAGRFCLDAAGPWIVQFYREWGKPGEASEWSRKIAKASLVAPSK